MEGGIEAAYRAEIDAAPDPQAKVAEIEARLNRLRSPFRTAEPFWIEEIIDPRDTRKLLVEFAGLAEKSVKGKNARGTELLTDREIERRHASQPPWAPSSTRADQGRIR